MTILHSYFLIMVFLSAIGICHNLRNSYTAAVVDYLHIYANYPKEVLQENVKEYVKYIRNASRQYADIIIFPEFGLVDIYKMYDAVSRNITELDEYSTFVPDPKFNIVPCEDKKLENYSMQLINISCTARMHTIYTVFNLLEKEYNNETGNLEFYNTNVILNRLGAVIARYRKVHLSEEPFLQPGTDIVTFTTDFNVTFGIFTCFDILFQYPALNLMDIPEVTDIIFPTAWYSETPFLQALSIQHGYAKANGVNLLVAGLQEPYNSDGGSAIFLADGTIADAYITNTRATKIIIHDVLIIKKRKPPNICQHTTSTSVSKQKKINAKVTDIDNFHINRNELKGYVYESLSKGPKTLTRICSNDGRFCCIFNITVNNSTNSNADYIHKLVVYNGLSSFGSKILGGIRVCAVIACLNDTNESCGYRTNTSLSTITFRKLQIQTIIDTENDTYEQPSTLQADLTPITEYIFCKTNFSDTKTKILMSITSSQSSLTTFGIFGRTYNTDTIESPETEAPPPEKVELNITLIIIIISFSTIILIATGGILWKFCTKRDN